MTSFGALFKQIFLQKRRYVNLVLLVQIFAIVFLALFTSWQNDNDLLWNMFLLGSSLNKNNFFVNVFSITIFTTVLADLAFTALACWQDEKINLSQTWRLIPINESEFYTENILTSIACCVYIFVIQILLSLIVFIPVLLTNHKVAHEFLGSFTINNTDSLINASNMIAFLFCIVFFIFTFVSLANFSSRAITDRLKVRNTKWIRYLVLGILIVIAVYLLFEINDHIQNAFTRTIQLHHGVE